MWIIGLIFSFTGEKKERKTRRHKKFIQNGGEKQLTINPPEYEIYFLFKRENKSSRKSWRRKFKWNAALELGRKSLLRRKVKKYTLKK